MGAYNGSETGPCVICRILRRVVSKKQTTTQLKSWNNFSPNWLPFDYFLCSRRRRVCVKLTMFFVCSCLVLSHTQVGFVRCQQRQSPGVHIISGGSSLGSGGGRCRRGRRGRRRLGRLPPDEHGRGHAVVRRRPWWTPSGLPAQPVHHRAPVQLTPLESHGLATGSQPTRPSR